jgi:hypothetical protein
MGNNDQNAAAASNFFRIFHLPSSVKDTSQLGSGKHFVHLSQDQRRNKGVKAR